MQDIYKLIDEINSQKLDDINSRVEQAIQSDNDEALFILGETLYRFGLMPQGLDVFRALYMKYPDEADVLIYFIEGLISENHTDEALEYLNDVELTPERLMLEADLYQQINMTDVAIDKVQQAIDMQPSDPILHFAIAELFYYDGQYLRASREYDTVLEAGEHIVNGVNIFSRLADSSLQSGNYSDALQWFEEIHEQEMTSEDYFKKAIAFDKNDLTQEAIKIVRTLLQKDPDYMQAYFYLQQLYENEKAYEDAIEIGKEGLRLNQFYKELMYSTGALQVEHGDAEDGVALLKQALEIDPAYQEPLMLLADYYRNEEDNEGLISLIQYTEEDDMDPQFMWQIAYALGEEERDKEAQHFYALAHETLHNNIDFLGDYYHYVVEIGDTATRDKLLDRLIELEPNNTQWHEERDRYL
ncbi:MULTISPECIES: tetratricopeptide repeat protein [unclassified Staphylococcus]|uniref:tetratricopeptide repeat protein n=1 Tax=unclassified Staphylococcus TaxID=91994 RepID=UPI0021D31F7F|nr:MULTISPECIES: tetratricopeptide repeat protein [unclassified Staphylococcus]UXR75323.1 tetratricopeptide repeat protein [Staphylococcus sp. IVB6233]UXR79526.1 tetratricopeptide repeat protein [Staphylococcus sp. IVB6218]